jgi:kynurenine formamidase
MKRLIDLTQVFTDHMPVYPGDPCARLYQTMSVNKNSFTDHKIESGMHVGTHIDAPLHMIAGGAHICDIPLNRCMGKGHLVDARGQQVIGAECLKGVNVQSGDIVLVWTGWSDKFNRPEYYEAYPVLTEDFALALVSSDAAMVGLDTPSPDRDPFPVHKILLGNNVLIIENMTNLAALNGRDFRIYAYPMKYKADAAPARLVAEI